MTAGTKEISVDVANDAKCQIYEVYLNVMDFQSFILQPAK